MKFQTNVNSFSYIQHLCSCSVSASKTQTLVTTKGKVIRCKHIENVILLQQ